MRKLFNGFLAGIVILAIISLVASWSISSIDKEKKVELYRQVQLFSDALAIVQSSYVDEVLPKDLIYGALEGMLGALDPHSQFLDPETHAELKIETEGRFGGLGIEITIKEGILTVVTPLEDTPAWNVGVKAGDRIVKIEGELTRDITLTEAVKKLRGEPGSEVNITVLREREEKLLDFKIIRAMINVKDIKEAQILEDGIAYIRIAEFRETTPKQLNKVMKELKQGGMESLILDLRNNPGGLLDIAAQVAAKFVPRGKLIVTTKGRKADQNIEMVSKESSDYVDLPLVILVNEGSASGSEIVAGALQDYKRAIVMGTKTFGKGSVQTIIPLSDGSALRLTTSKYMTPKGRLIVDQAITPDVVVEQIELALQEDEDKEGDVFEELEKKEDDSPGVKKYQDDYQLLRAIDLLKAIKVYKDFAKDK